jgi:hypothetical protein
MKIKTIRLECQVCSKISSTQLFYNSAGELRYGRCRHYTGQLNGKPQFEYHQQAIEYLQRKLNEMQKNDNQEVGHIGQLNNKITIDLKENENCSNLVNTGGRSLAWLGHQVPNLTTRVQIPVTAPNFNK